MRAKSRAGEGVLLQWDGKRGSLRGSAPEQGLCPCALEPGQPQSSFPALSELLCARGVPVLFLPSGTLRDSGAGQGARPGARPCVLLLGDIWSSLLLGHSCSSVHSGIYCDGRPRWPESWNSCFVLLHSPTAGDIPPSTEKYNAPAMQAGVLASVGGSFP